MNAQSLALAFVYALHFLATVVWIGGLATLVWLVIPAAQNRLEPAAFADLLTHIQRRLDPLGWLCLSVLAATGMFQLSANPHYTGFLSISSSWAVAILLKHGVVALMAATSGYMTWGLLPALRRSALRQASGVSSPELTLLQRRNIRLLRANLALAVVVLLLTAVARAA